ncbi:Protein-L-isoaspartate O-methyltransferase [Roseovarius albus]|uniref:Protein-L-isoaspartate O-methyltransferase n=1 Tax=Roseovarius albus TaxID=1247867 RepID=A0A1X6Y918_9RHOB|nr:protein-L-isoaspartate O-methyltransferase [Roseovarius albus]SLN13632.1 Protein-L-isoaspartate O-methyltransferase [Roseovarius albus]
MTDFATRRTFMVDSQIRPSDVTKFPIIDAMLSVPREAFVPAEKVEAAYVGDNLEIAHGRVVMDPRTIAKMLDALDIRDDELVLDVGCTYGYFSALMARMAEAVVAVDSDAAMLEDAQSTLSDIGADNVMLHRGALAEGAAEHGPYDVVVIEGAVENLPDALLNQIKDGGRIACLFAEGALGVVKIGYKIDGQVNWRFAFNASAPVLPGFEQEEQFSF